MIQMYNFVSYSLTVDSEFEQLLIRAIVDAYQLGTDIKLGRQEIVINDMYDEYVDLYGTDRGRDIFLHFMPSVQKILAEHDKIVGEKAILEYCKKNNLEYKKD